MPSLVWQALGITGLLSLLLGTAVIPKLKELKFGQVVRSDGPSSHAKKSGTPTMGGVIFLIPALLVTWIYGGILDLRVSSLVVLTAITLGYGLVGLVDDALKTVFRRSLGLLARQKLIWQIVLASLAVSVLYFFGHSTTLVIPYTAVSIEVGAFYWVFVIFLCVGFSNAVNLTDGIDALAGGTMLIASLAYVAVALASGVREIALFAGCMAGGLLGFLYFNRHPAKVFMGDVGSLGLGGALVAMGVLTGTELFLPIIGAVFVWSTVSVILQVVYFRITKGKRIFRMAPYHHALELMGWNEKKIVATYYLAGILFAVVGIFGLQ